MRVKINLVLREEANKFNLVLQKEQAVIGGNEIYARRQEVRHRTFNAAFTWVRIPSGIPYAAVVESVDTLDLKSNSGNRVRVRVSSAAPNVGLETLNPINWSW